MRAFLLSAMAYAVDREPDSVSMLQAKVVSDRQNQVDEGGIFRKGLSFDEMPPIVNLKDFQVFAKSKMDPRAYTYYEGGALDMITLNWNEEAWKKIQIWPRYMVDVSDIDISSKFMGRDIALPVIVPPMALQKLAHPDGEIGLARAAADAGAIYTMAESATTTIQDICGNVTGPKMFQIYISTNRDQSQILMDRANSCGKDLVAIIVTVDAPVPGRREADIRNAFSPKDLGFELVNRRFPELENQTQAPVAGSDSTDDNVNKNFAWRGTRDSGLNWEDTAWLKEAAKGTPLILKGITHPDDAELAIKYGYSAIWVSNHGGRQLDGGPATAEALSGVVDAVRGRVPVIVDSGLRRGGDVVKALSIGANAVAMGRPILFSLAANGTAGASRGFQILKDEIKSVMALTGVTKVRQLRRKHVRLPGQKPPKAKKQRKGN